MDYRLSFILGIRKGKLNSASISLNLKTIPNYILIKKEKSAISGSIFKFSFDQRRFSLSMEFQIFIKKWANKICLQPDLTRQRIIS